MYTHTQAHSGIHMHNRRYTTTQMYHSARSCILPALILFLTTLVRMLRVLSLSLSLSLSVSLSLPDNSCCALFWCCCAEWPHDACHDDMRVTTCISVCVHTLAKIKAKFTYWQKWKLRPRSLHNIYKLRMLVQKELGRSIIHFIWNT